jgi:endonuclease/exonuclease/phosphatase family metal-dependent hydrolase
VKKFATRAAAPALAAAVILTPASAGAAPIPLPDTGGAAPRESTASAPATVSFNVATFNVVGASHSRGRGGMRSGNVRMKGAVSYLRKHRVTLAGFQELEPKQAVAFRKKTGSRWALVGAPSRSGKSTDTRNAVGYLKSDFSLMKRTSVPITYFFGKRVNIPLVKLRSKKNGAMFWVLNTHNPADVHGNAARWRAESVRRELKQIRRLRSNGQTVLFTGDMNAKKDFFCKATRSRVLHSASGGSVGKRCRYPSANGIDWVLGTRDVRFRKWRADTSTRSRGISDHPIVVARATIRR